MKVEQNDDEARYIHVEKVQDKKSIENIKGERKLEAYKVFIRDNITSKTVIESWWKSHKFDDLAFRGRFVTKLLSESEKSRSCDELYLLPHFR